MRATPLQEKKGKEKKEKLKVEYTTEKPLLKTTKNNQEDNKAIYKRI